MFKYNEKTIYAGRAWIDDNHVKHPSNWHIWNEATKASMGITEIIEDPEPDSRLYIWSMNSNGKITKTAKSLVDEDVKDSDGNPVKDEDGNQLVNLGLRSTLKNEVKSQQGSLLAQTDWTVIRKADAGIEVPANIQTWRDAIRDKATEMENAIDAATNVDDIAALFMTWDKDGNKSGILYEWPILNTS